MNDQIKSRLEEHFESCFQEVAKKTLAEILDELRDNNPDAYTIGETSIGKLYDDDELALFEEAKKDTKLEELFNNVKVTVSGKHELLVEQFRHDIIASLETIKKTLPSHSSDDRNQVIFLEHNHEPYFYWCGFGEGDYPILEEPQYISFSRAEVYNGIGRIDFSEYWEALDELEEYMYDLEIGDSVMDSDEYAPLRGAFRYKLYLLLHLAFEGIPIEEFDGIPTKLPLFIYGNEHDCEVMNIYCY